MATGVKIVLRVSLMPDKGCSKRGKLASSLLAVRKGQRKGGEVGEGRKERKQERRRGVEDIFWLLLLLPSPPPPGKLIIQQSWFIWQTAADAGSARAGQARRIFAAAAAHRRRRNSREVGGRIIIVDDTVVDVDVAASRQGRAEHGRAHFLWSVHGRRDLTNGLLASPRHHGHPEDAIETRA